ncbi:MAG: sugar phosphate nucleotidyltransferase [candidate division WOR-3 bacterium]
MKVKEKLKKAVILSAGTGERLKPISNNIPKSLFKIKGKEILLRNIKNLEEFVEEFLIVVNPKFSRKLKEFVENNGIKAKIVINEYPERENGYSLYLLKDYVEEGEKFIVLMGDHIYEKDFLKEAINGEGLIVDEIGKYIDKDEATKVYYENGKVIEIGKNIERFNAYDTGFIIIDKNFLKFAIELEKEKEKITISEIIKRAKLNIFQVSGYFWIDLDTYEDVKKAVNFLRGE